MIHIRQIPSMPSTLVSGYQSHAGHHQLPQVRDFTWDWDKVKSRAGDRETTRKPVGYNSQCFVPSPRFKMNDIAPSVSNVSNGHYEIPLASASHAPPYPTPHSHSRQGSKSQPFYQSYYSARQNQSPPKKKDNNAEREESARRRASNDGNLIAPYLQIPEAINKSKGSLPEFAAQITCLFWFESSQVLQLAQEPNVSSSMVAPLNPDATPSTGFRKWVTTILSMTQVTPNVILLGLLFIYRLKKLNPSVKGKAGSEFRLLTVALMLGNKFLDDNTYTNKTWAEVSGITVQEIHVMEVEFLSNMRYSLFSSVEEWDEWMKKLGNFSSYFDKAVEAADRKLTSGMSLQPLNRAPNLPSPPVSVHTSPPLGRPSPNHSTLSTPHSMSSLFNPALPSHTPLPPPEMDPTKQWSRKRSLEDNQLEGPSKRMSSYTPSAVSTGSMTPSTMSYANSPLPRLPMPNIPNANLRGSGAPSAQLPLPSSRAMSTVFPGAARWPPNMTLPSLQPSQHLNHQGSSGTSSPVSLPTRPSPYGHTSGTSSPTSYAFPQPTHTPAGLSPSGMPLVRHSPYKPVRGVHTLLVPPPSAAVHHAPQQLSYNQMRYQPLGQPKTERRTGVLPCLPFETWSQSHTMRHCLPQPTFST